VKRQTRTDLAHGVEAGALGLEAAGINPATPAGTAHYQAVLGPILATVLRPGSEPPADDARASDDDPAAAAGGALTSMADVGKLSAEEVADRWDEVAAVIKAARSKS